MKMLACLGLTVPFAAPVVAQSITTTVSALTPITVQVASGPLVATNTQPAGPLATPGQVWTYLGASEQAIVGWNAITYSDRATAQLNHHLEALFMSPIQVGTNTHEFLVQFAAVGGTVLGQLTVTRDSWLPSGMPFPSVALDYGNDGTIDVPNAFSTTLPPQTFTASPLQVRVIMNSQLPGNGYSATDLRFTVLPGNDVGYLQNAMNCLAGGPPWLGGGQLLPPLPVFADRGVDMRLWVVGAPAVHVIGLSQQPLLLPSAGLVPCLLVPSPDIVLFQPQSLHIPLPASVRPITFHVQGVAITPIGLLSTEGYTVFAN